MESCKKNKDRVNIFIDGSFGLSCYSDIVAEHGLGQGMEVDAGLLERITNEDGDLFAFQTALKYVSIRQRTRKETENKLRQCGLDQARVLHALTRLEEYGYIDDAEYAALYAAELRHKYGKKVVYQKLLQKGISQSEAAEAVAGQDDAALLREHASRLAERYGSEPDSYKRKQKMIRALLQKGFEYDDIRAVVEQAHEE